MLSLPVSAKQQSTSLRCKSAKDKTVQSVDTHFEFCLRLLFVIFQQLFVATAVTVETQSYEERTKSAMRADSPTQALPLVSDS